MLVLIYNFMNILKNKLYITFYFKIIRYSPVSRGIATSVS